MYTGSNKKIPWCTNW